MTADDDWADCPECGKQVKAKNIERHLRKFHEMAPTDAKKIKTDLEKEQKKKKKKGIGAEPGKAADKKFEAVAVVIAVIILIAAVGVYYFWSSSDNGSPSNGDNPPITDPTLAEFTTVDGFKLMGNFYTAKAGVLNTSEFDRPTLILVHGMNEKRTAWDNYGIVESALGWGFNVMVYDVRGHGESVYKNGVKHDLNQFSDDDFKNMDKDVRAAVSFVKANYRTNEQFVVVGASVGANAALNAAVLNYDIRAVGLLSPGLNYVGMTTYQPMYDYGTRPVFIAAGQLDSVADDAQQLNDRAYERDPNRDNVFFMLYDLESEHGTNLFKIQKFNEDIETWLKNTMLTGL